MCAQADFDVAQALAPGELGEGHAQVLIQAGEALDVTIPAVLDYQPAERVQRTMLHELREHILALVHDDVLPRRRQPRANEAEIGNTPQTSIRLMHSGT